MVDIPLDKITMLEVLDEWLPKKLLERGIELVEVIGNENEFIGELKEFK